MLPKPAWNICAHSVSNGSFSGSRRRSKSTLFLDIDPTVFIFILDYLRNGAEVVLPEEPMTLRKMERDAKNYGLEGLQRIIEDHNENLAARKEAGALLPKGNVRQMPNDKGALINKSPRR